MRARSLLPLLALAACAHPTTLPMPPPPSPPSLPAATLATLAPDVSTHGFTVVARYTGADGTPLGARFVHDRTKFTFDYLQIESAPQGFIWVNSVPTSDKGEPHTQEHLLLGKGNRGRTLGSASAMALTESSAFTDQLRTAYHFHTVAGNEVFWPVFGGQLDALLNPDYTDDEIRREVRNFGVDKSDDGVLHLEEKGTVYNEMVRAYESPETLLARAAGRLLYGAHHPLAYDAGGEPAAIRTMTPTDIRAFHAAAYHLANMGMIAAFPSAMGLPDVLDHVGATLDAAAGRTGRVSRDAELPPPAAAAPGTVELVDYPFATAANPGPMLLAWPATRDLDAAERLALDVFADAFAGDESTTLYKQLIDSKTRVLDTGASGVAIFHSEEQGEPLLLSLAGVQADKLDATTIVAVRTLVLAELTAMTKLGDGDPALARFAARVQSRIVALRRRFAKNLDTPPGFGFRGIGSEWLNLLRSAGRQHGFDKSLVFASQLDALDALVRQPGNPWRERLARWGLLELPYGLAARPSPALRATLDRDHQQRVVDELVRLRTQDHTPDDASTLAKVAADEAAVSAQLDEATRATPLPPLVAAPPMTRDDGLRYTTGAIGAATFLRATVDSMASARVSIAYELSTIAPEDQWYLALLPTLLTEVGVIDHGTPISAEEVRERLRQEVLELSVQYDTSPSTGRVELVVSGAGSNPDETRRALGWMSRVLASPDWRLENLPRLRDVVDHAVIALRSQMTGAEETWVADPRDAWDRQREPLRLHVASFLTMAHDLHRLRWMLRDPRDAKVTKEATAFIASLASARTLPRAKLVALAVALGGDGKLPAGYSRWSTARLSAPARALARDAASDLGALLGDLPDGSLAQDWTYLCTEMAADLATGAPTALAALARIRVAFQIQSKARLVEVGSTAHQAAIAADVEAVVRAIPQPPHVAGFGGFDRTGVIARRLAERDRTVTLPLAGPTFVGLVAPSTSSGVFENLVHAAGYRDTSDDALLDFLASSLFTGHGAHSMFMKTWAAGLAYSNGLHPNAVAGTLEYYAERCPLLPQTLRFVIGELGRVTADASIARYAVASAFDSRVASSYEWRAAALAADLADGVTPEIVRAFRTKILAVAQRPDLAKALYARMPAVYARVLPGMGPLDATATYFVIGPDKQLDAYAQYLAANVGKGTTLHRLYPRDFWVVRPTSPASPPR